MFSQINPSDLLMDLSIEQQQLLSGGRRYDGDGGYDDDYDDDYDHDHHRRCYWKKFCYRRRVCY